MPRRFGTPILLLAAALAALTVACGGGNGSGTPAATATQAPSAETIEIEVLMKDNVFEPDEIRIKAGQKVKIEAKNEGVAIHNMIVSTKDAEGKDFMSDSLVNPGDDSEFELVVMTPGTYEFFCAFHLPEMVGSLIVE